MRLTELKQLKKGMTVYKAYGLGNRSEVVGPITLTSDPFMSRIGFIEILCESYDRFGITSDSIFPGDANIGAHYNEHRLYTTSAEAQGYVDYIKRTYNTKRRF